MSILYATRVLVEGRMIFMDVCEAKDDGYSTDVIFIEEFTGKNICTKWGIQ